MEIWRVGYDNAERPKVISARNLTIAFILHASCFALFWLYSFTHDLFRKDEEIVPIDLTLVVNENLKGKENEPPPLQKPEPPKPKPPKQRPKPKEPDKPKELEKIETNIVAKVDKKLEKTPKKPEPKKPEPKKKTPKEIREDRLKKMRASAKTVGAKTVKIEVKNAPSGDGRTSRKTLTDAEIQRLLNAGYKPGTSEQLAENELQLGYSLIKSAFEEKWDTPPWTDTLKPMIIRVWFGSGGRIVKFNLEKSSGDAKVDQSIKSAATRVGSVPALPAAFIERFRSKGVPVQFEVKPK